VRRSIKEESMSDDTHQDGGLVDGHLTRRSFLKWSAALGGTAMLAGSGLKLSTQIAEGAAERAANDGQWITAACWHNCGGRCLIKANVVDGAVVRVKTDDTHPDSPNFPQQRACQRGRSQRSQVLGPDRLKYPMKRKNWAPGGGKKELRGQDEWVRISWDEALNLAATEIKRIKETYGNTSILITQGAEMARVLSLYGGYCERWGAVSWGAWPEVYPYITGIQGNGSSSGNDRLRLRQSKLIVLMGANPAWSSGGSPTYNYLQAKKAGTKFIVVDPLYSDTVQLLADQWIPIRPATDTTLLLGMAYHMIVNNLHDQKFLDTYCVGFDADHMPKGADSKENFKDYVLGTYDGQPKTPEWASQICGVDPEVIRRFAYEFATTHPASVITGGAPARINNGECMPHSLLTVALMAGNMGAIGSGASPTMHTASGNGGPSLVTAGANGVPAVKNPTTDTRINNCELWDAVLTGKVTAGPGPKKDINIKMIYTALGADLNQRAGAKKGIQAYRSVDFALTQNLWLTTPAKYSDIVLPVISPWEAEAGGFVTGNREMLIYYSQVTKPLFEAKDDQWIATEIGKRLGLTEDKLAPLSLKQQVFNQLAGAKVAKADGSGTENLVTITDADIAEMGVTGKAQSGRIGYKEFKGQGLYQVPRSPDDKFGFTEFEAFRKDPVANPLKTPSGKFQIHSQELADHIASFGFNKKSPIAKYDPAIEGYDDPLRSQYPLQMITPHYRRRAHSCLDNVPWLREAFPQEFWINPADAEARGIKPGDIVKISSRHGTVARPAFVTERMLPGVVALGEGAWIQVDEATGIDMAGATNMLNGDIATGQGHTGHNSCLVQVEKFTGTLQPDRTWPRRIPLKEA
jgi:anaerobic dimethyl sulfoxide reductase subunit A